MICFTASMDGARLGITFRRDLIKFSDQELKLTAGLKQEDTSAVHRSLCGFGPTSVFRASMEHDVQSGLVKLHPPLRIQPDSQDSALILLGIPRIRLSDARLRRHNRNIFIRFDPDQAEGRPEEIAYLLVLPPDSGLTLSLSNARTSEEDSVMSLAFDGRNLTQTRFTPTPSRGRK